MDGVVPEPALEGLLVVGADRREVDVGGGAARGGDGDGLCVTGAGPGGTDDDEAVPLPGRRVGCEPVRDLAGVQERRLFERDLSGGLRGPLWKEGRQEAVAGLGPEFQPVEQCVDITALRGGPDEVGELDTQIQVPGELGDAAVELDLREVFAETLPHLALDLVRVRDELGQAAVLGDPLGGGLVTDLRNPRQVVGVVPAQRGDVRVLGRRDAVLRLDRLGREARELRDALDRIEHGDGVGNELQRVAVTGTDEDPGIARVRGARREGGDDVVGLVPLE